MSNRKEEKKSSDLEEFEKLFGKSNNVSSTTLSFSVVIESEEQPQGLDVEPDERSYRCVKPLRRKGRRKTSAPAHWLMTEVDWDDLNHSELMELAKKELIHNIRDLDEVDSRIHPGIRRHQLIAMILGYLDPRTLPVDPVDVYRNAIQMMIYNNYRYIESQLDCNHCCWECSVPKIMEHTLEFRQTFPQEIPPCPPETSDE